MNISPGTLEVEVKFHIVDPEKMRRRLLTLDAAAQPEVFESNLRFEDADHTLKANDKLLRLRRDKGCRLTYKCKPSQTDERKTDQKAERKTDQKAERKTDKKAERKPDQKAERKTGQEAPQCKVYQELEVTVNDFDTMLGILHGLGFHTAQIYEKWRQTFHWNDVEICLDTMPYGTFLEIEGTRESIKQTAQELGLPWEKRILKNYLAMFEELRTRNALPFRDVTFENFESHPADITSLLNTFEAGSL